MKTFNLIALFSFAILAGGCARDNAVAMNLYDPNSGDYEVASGITVEITQDMIDNFKKRKVK